MEGAAPPASSGSEVTGAGSGKVDAGGGAAMEERFADLCKVRPLIWCGLRVVVSSVQCLLLFFFFTLVITI